MIINFEDECWAHGDDDWTRSLIQILVLLAMHEQHALHADADLLLTWCKTHLHKHVDYLKTRLASAQFRSHALTINVSPGGATSATTAPPWRLTPGAASKLVNTPLRLVLENDRSDRLFVESTVPSFSQWCSAEWVTPAMGGGATMEKDISATAKNVMTQWRTFYLFDSDRLHPNELSPGWTPPRGDGCQGHKFETACASLPSSRWHRLMRRSIENYLPDGVLQAANPTAASALFSPSVGSMGNYYNVKMGLAGDGISPKNPAQAIRASRCNGFWSSLPANEITALERGFGSKVSSEFQNVPANHSWPADVIAEMDSFGDALQDAI